MAEEEVKEPFWDEAALEADVLHWYRVASCQTASKVLTSTDSYQGFMVFTAREPEVEKWEVTCAGSPLTTAGVRANLIRNQLLSCPAGAERLPSGGVSSYQPLHLPKNG